MPSMYIHHHISIYIRTPVFFWSGWWAKGSDSEKSRKITWKNQEVLSGSFGPTLKATILGVDSIMCDFEFEGLPVGLERSDWWFDGTMHWTCFASTISPAIKRYPTTVGSALLEILLFCLLSLSQSGRFPRIISWCSSKFHIVILHCSELDLLTTAVCWIFVGTCWNHLWLSSDIASPQDLYLPFFGNITQYLICGQTHVEMWSDMRISWKVGIPVFDAAGVFHQELLECPSGRHGMAAKANEEWRFRLGSACPKAISSPCSETARLYRFFLGFILFPVSVTRIFFGHDGRDRSGACVSSFTFQAPLIPLVTKGVVDFVWNCYVRWELMRWSIPSGTEKFL